ncbi:MAG: hypothetical protein IPJ65_30085 [Archangiaceae bacterium]|nr:hypothetical protein [Archangiaceae bacterium]
MSPLSVLLLATLAATPESLLVAPYQALGVDAATVTALTEAFRLAPDATRFAALPAAESEKVTRSAMMCGEDGACLATIGQRSNARWVLAFGIGKVGSALLVTAVFVDVTAGKELMRGSRRVPEGGADWISTARSLADEVVRPPVEPLVVQVPVEVVKPQKTHKWRPWAFAGGTATVVFTGLTTLLSLIAWGNYNALTKAASSGTTSAMVPSLATAQRGYNAWADTALSLTLVSGAVWLLFSFLEATEKPVVPVLE